MTTTVISNHNGIPALFIVGQPVPPIVAYVGPDYVGCFRAAATAISTPAAAG